MSHGFHPLSHANKEVVLAADFNRYGTRLVTGSADHRLRVFEDKDGTWVLIEEWRAHNAEVTDVKWYPHPHPPVLASISEDTRLKVWLEDATAAPLSGRRFGCVFSQSPSELTPYTALAFHSPSPTSTYLALATRNGLLSLLEPVDADSGAAPTDWREIDSFWICHSPVPRGTETAFRLSFQDADRPGWSAVRAGLDPRALSLAVTALNDVKVYRVAPHAWVGGEQYRFTAPVAELTGARAIVRDVAWCPTAFRERDLIASAAADGYVRIYEVWAPKPVDTEPGQRTPFRQNRKSLGAAVPSGIGAGLAGADGKAGELEEPKVPHMWQEVAELKHDGVWKVEWIRGSNMLISTGDSGRAHVWAQGKDEKWTEFADFGPEAQADA